MHIVLLVITLFFGTGLLISEAIMCERRQDSTVEVPAPPPAHPLNQTQQARQRPRRLQCRRIPNQRQPQDPIPAPPRARAHACTSCGTNSSNTSDAPSHSRACRHSAHNATGHGGGNKNANASHH